MHTGNYHNPIGFYLEEEALRETSYARPSCFRMHRLEGEGTSRDKINSGIRLSGIQTTGSFIVS